MVDTYGGHVWLTRMVDTYGGHITYGGHASSTYGGLHPSNPQSYTLVASAVLNRSCAAEITEVL